MKPAVHREAHILLQAKGGVGKSLVAALIAQWLQDRGREVHAYDNDPATASLSAWRGLEVRRCELVRDDAVDQGAYDRMVMEILEGAGDVVIDNGASNYLPLVQYLTETDLFGFLEAHGIRPVVHAPVMGGGSLLVSVGGLDDVLGRLPESVAVIVWLNEHEGPIRDGETPWTEFAAYARWRHRLAGQVTLREQRMALFRDVMRDRIVGPSRTFAEAQGSDDLNLLEKQRARMIWKDLTEQMNVAMGSMPWPNRPA